MYRVKEIFYSLQGEGANSGKPAVFCRFAGCNLWSGHEQDRATAICRFCDTDFLGGRQYSSGVLAVAIRDRWSGCGEAFAVLTGGEPALQVDQTLLSELRALRVRVAIETNGTVELKAVPDWVTVSPKAGTELKVRRADELKLVYPQEGLSPADLDWFEAEHRYIQPMDGEHRNDNTKAAVRFCLEDTRWKLSMQIHKIIGIR